MIKNYIIDTNVVIHDPKFMYNFEDNHLILPIIVLEELDNLKKKDGIVGYHAREVLKELNKLRHLGNYSKGIPLPNKGTIRIETNYMDFTALPDGTDRNKNDNKIIAIALNLAKAHKKTPTILVTKDAAMTVLAESLGLQVQDYENDKIHGDELYRGYSEVYLTSDIIDRIYRNKNGIPLPEEMKEEILYPNHFFHIRSLDKSNHEILVKYKNGRIVPLEYSNNMTWGLKPINREQKMAFELLHDPDVPLVSISGGAGSGKSILAIAYALESVLEKGDFRKLVFVRPVVPAGNDIGFLPGEEKDKLRPWMSAFYDAVDNLIDQKSRHKREEKINIIKKGEKPNFTADNFVETYSQIGLLELKTFNYMRGRTLANTLVIIDETQETTPHLAKLMLTRAGQGSKFIIIGDPSMSQIDNVLVDAKSNGLVYLIEKLKFSPLSGHITLKHVERSPLAVLAEGYL
ncbi:PhoH family protein [Alkaliphilus serpentinus]|uniref:PhoH family protein n=1 Tax=Alkaliphilus serpentinus TaxID=1482731 RepID=A0A833MEA6_9FIRM|nr:PhoH family protein [Alkaliphilus serpentinus]KAB3530699.1 PhoH family protein [Alkaliphilus serpentinus]